MFRLKDYLNGIKQSINSLTSDDNYKNDLYQNNTKLRNDCN